MLSCGKSLKYVHENMLILTRSRYPDGNPILNWVCNRPQKSVSRMVHALLATAQTPSMFCELIARRTHFLTIKKTSSNINDENGVGDIAEAASKLSCEKNGSSKFKFHELGFWIKFVFLGQV